MYEFMYVLIASFYIVSRRYVSATVFAKSMQVAKYHTCREGNTKLAECENKVYKKEITCRPKQICKVIHYIRPDI